VSALGNYMGGAAAIVRRDVLTLLSYRLTIISQLLSVIFNLTLFYYLSRLVRVGQFTNADDYFAYVVVGLLILQILQSTLGVASVLRAELLAGTFERLLLSPFGAVASIVSLVVFPCLFALFMSVISLTFAGIAFSLPVEWSTAPLAAPVALLGAVAFTAFSLCFLAVTVVVKQILGGTGWIIAAIAMVSGLYFPITLLPGWIRWMSSVQPFTPAVDLIRHLLVGTPLTQSAALELLKIVGFAAVLVPLSIGCIVAALRYSRRKGTIIEY
jgi:ABC-2 type transport system permease protein